MASAVILFLAVAVFTAALSAYLSTYANVFPWILGSIVLAVIGGVLRTRAVKERIPFLRTRGMRLRAFHERGWKLRIRIRAMGRMQPLEAYRDEIVEFDRAFWRLIEAEYPDRLSVYREVQSGLGRFELDESWHESAMRVLDARMGLLGHLLTNGADN